MGKKRERRIALTKSIIAGLEPRAKGYLVWDADAPGFGVRVLPNGTKSFFVFYRTADGTQRRESLGLCSTVDVGEARADAKDKQGEARHGKDPLGEKQEKRGAITLTEFWDIYRRDYSDPKNKASSIILEKIHWGHTIKPALGSKKVTAITKAHIERLHASMSGRRVTANRVLALLSTMFAKAEDWGYRLPGSPNPCRGVGKYKEQGRERYLAPDEFLRIGQALTELEAGGLCPQTAINAIRLILFTGCRRGEVLGLRWDWVDLSGACLDLPDSKTGRKKIYLNKLALDVLESIPRHASGWVFPGEVDGNHLYDLKGPWEKVCRLAKIGDLHVHDLRHSFASIAVALNLNLPTIGKLLGHRQTETTARYAHLMDDPLRAANQAIGESIADLMSGAAKVIELRPKQTEGAAAEGE